MYYAGYEFSVYFLKFLSFFLLVKSRPTIWNSQNGLVIWHRDIYDCGFDVHFWTMLVIQFFGQIWSQNFVKIVSKDCYTCCMPNFSFP